MSGARDRSGLLGWERRGPLGIITIDDPPGNRLPSPAFADVEELQRWFADEGLLGIAVTGRGRHFSAGADLEALERQSADEAAFHAAITRGHAVIDALAAAPVPTVAAIGGACLGGGFEIALACHLRVCTPRAVFAFPEAGLGLIPGLGGSVRLPRLVGRDRALMLMLSSDTLDAARALELGLVHQVAESGTALDAALALLTRLTRDRSRAVIAAIVEAINNADRLSPREAMAREAALFCRLAHLRRTAEEMQ